MQEKLKYQCPKCGHAEYEIGQLRGVGGTFSKLFNVQNKHFTHVTCARCKYTELYKTESSMLGNIFDFFMN